MGNVVRGMQNIRKNQRKILEMKSNITEKNPFKRLISRLNTVKEKKSMNKNRSIKIIQLKHKEKP